MKNKLFLILSWFCFLLFTFVFCAVAGNIILKGLHGFEWSYLISGFENSGRSGGISSVIVSTLVITFGAILVSLFISVLTAVSIDHLGRYRGVSRFLKLSLDTLGATPSIVFGLIGYVIFCDLLGFGYSLLSGALTLALMILPIQTRIILIGLANVPKSIELAAHALNLNPFASYFKIKINTVRNQIISGSFIGLGRAMAETAALLFTSGYGVKMPTHILDSGRTLSIHIYDLAMNIPGGNTNAYRSAFVLISIVFLISLIANKLHGKIKYRGAYYIWN